MAWTPRAPAFISCRSYSLGKTLEGPELSDMQVVLQEKVNDTFLPRRLEWMLSNLLTCYSVELAFT